MKSEEVIGKNLPKLRPGRFLAGAGGFEPATHGFGVDMGKRVTSRTLAFSELFGCLETMFENSNFN